MIVYLLCFLVTGIFALINEHALKNNYRILALITTFLVLIIPAIVAGVRSYDIGTDVNFYVKKSIDLATNFSAVKNWFAASSIPGYITQSQEKGYLLLEYVSTRIVPNTHFFLFLVALIENIFIYLSLYKLKNNCSIFMGELIFLFTQYNSFYNMVRQGIAISICLFAVSILVSKESKKYLKFILWIMIAFQFHRTAIIALIFLGIYIVLEKNFSILKQTILIFILLGIMLSLVPVTQYAINIGIFPARYLEYFSGGLAYNSGKISIIGIGIYSCGYLVLFQGMKYLGPNKNFYLVAALMDIGLILMTNISFYLFRLSSYFLIIRVLSMSQKTLYKLEPDRKIYNNSILLELEAFLSIILYFVYFLGYLNWHQTIPYIFMTD
ncbi:EpsG family protein [Lactobacillus intestinalis]|uniref:EpsG family protein n=1 Tax=Lactobacillus intestinalis TaxID=151781 RepID=UPI001F5A914C|nr:EpsG family protein [Lactobacillus intestinalis]